MTDDQLRIEQTVAAWGRIEQWLARHAPRSHRRLPAPATEQELLAAEHAFGLRLPPDLRAFYLLHNGTGPADDFEWPTRRPDPAEPWDPETDPSGYLLPNGGIGPLAKLAQWVGGPASHGDEDEPGRRHLAFAGSDPDGLYGLFADCTPGPGYGRVGCHAEAEAPEPDRWPSLAAYLAGVADALEAGRAFTDTGWAPAVRYQCLDWDLA
ncbi:SMI1/KNR4 family protein [Kitasatospora cinereorecta]|uniref:SMI1/KNR4 family protein n=1 Tax=Kitasatospora cinereorecta TaxID=285560 RepID=A0ABW0VDC4_9ACTN